MTGAELFLRDMNKRIERMMALLTPTGVILGLVLSHHVSGFKPAVTWLFAFLTLVNSMSVSVRDFYSAIQKPRPILIYALFSYAVIPLLVFALASLFFHGNSDVITGYVLLYCIPTAVVSCMWCGIYNGNMALSITLLVIATCLAPLTTPSLVHIFSSSSITIDTSGMVRSLLLMVVIPSVIGMFINYASKGMCNDHVAPCLKPFTKIALLFVVTINTSQVADRLIAEADWSYIPQVLAALMFSVMGFLISFGAAHLFRFSKADQVSVVYAIGMKNISAALVLAIDFFPPAAAIPVIAGILLQQTICAVISQILFGEKKEK